MFATPFFHSLLSFFTEGLELSHLCHGVEFNDIQVEYVRGTDPQQVQTFIRYESTLLFSPSATGESSRRGICHQNERDCTIVPANDPWIERGVYPVSNNGMHCRLPSP